MKEEDVTSLIKPANSFTTSVTDRFYPPPNSAIGLRTHWEKLPFKFYPAELSVWAGINGHGKSLFLNQLFLDLCFLNNQRGGICSFEMPSRKTLHRMVRQALGKADPTPREIYLCMEWLSTRIFLYDKVGTNKLPVLLSVFDHMREQYGVTQILIDSMVKCGIGPEDWDAQCRFVNTLQDYAQQHCVNIHLVVHSRKLLNESDVPGKMDVKGRGEITDLPDSAFSIWRNKKKESQMIDYHHNYFLPNGMTYGKLLTEYDCRITCMKSREDGSESEGMFGLYFHRPSFQFLERYDQEPVVYFDSE